MFSPLKGEKQCPGYVNVLGQKERDIEKLIKSTATGKYVPACPAFCPAWAGTLGHFRKGLFSEPKSGLRHALMDRRREHWTGCKAAELDAGALSRAKVAGYEPGPDGYMTGRDPRTMTPAELVAIGHSAMSPMEAIRAKCLDYCAGSYEVRLCVAITCPSWPFRMGASPWKAPRRLSETQRAAARERGLGLALRRSLKGAGIV